MNNLFYTFINLTGLAYQYVLILYLSVSVFYTLYILLVKKPRFSSLQSKLYKINFTMLIITSLFVLINIALPYKVSSRDILDNFYLRDILNIFGFLIGGLYLGYPSILFQFVYQLYISKISKSTKPSN